jgi:hypothetical protein
MSSLKDLDELVDLLIRARKIVDHTDCSHVKLLIELAMFELGKSVVQQSLMDPDGHKNNIN